MKIKTDFVTNSSCASFVIPRKKLNDHQIHLIEEHITYGKMLMMPSAENREKWTIIIEDDEVFGETSMDNFNMLKYLLNFVKVKEKHIKYEGCY